MGVLILARPITRISHIALYRRRLSEDAHVLSHAVLFTEAPDKTQ